MTSTTYGFVAGIATLISMIAFLAVVAWSYSGRRTADYARAARMALEEDANISSGGP